MKKYNSYLLASILAFFTISLSGCEAIEGIFKAGFWIGVIVVVGIIGLILWLVSKRK